MTVRPIFLYVRVELRRDRQTPDPIIRTSCPPPPSLPSSLGCPLSTRYTHTTWGGGAAGCRVGLAKYMLLRGGWVVEDRDQAKGWLRELWQITNRSLSMLYSFTVLMILGSESCLWL